MKQCNLLVLLCLIPLVWGCVQRPGTNGLEYPQLEPSPTAEQRFGIPITDPYSNLVQLRDTGVQNWFRAQDSLAEAYFLGNKATKGYLDRFKRLENGETPIISIVRRSENGGYFYVRYDPAEERDKVYYKGKVDSDPVLLFDSSEFEEGVWRVNYLNPSYDGKSLAIGLHMGDDFASEVVFIDVGTRTILPDRTTNINPDFGGIEWLPDGSGFMYLYFPVVDMGKEGYKKNSYSILHRFGGEDLPIFGTPSGLDLPMDHYPKVKIRSSKDRYVIGYTASSNNFYDAYISDLEPLLAGRPNWRPFFTEEDKVFYNDGEIRGDVFTYLQATSNGNRLCQVSIKNPDFKDPKVLAAGSVEEPITQFELTRDHIYFQREKYGVEVSLFRLGGSKALHQLKPPFTPGSASFYGESVAHNDIGVILDGWISPEVRYKITSDGKFEPLPFDSVETYPGFQNLTSRQVMVPSHDGEMVPLSLVHLKDLPKDGTHKVFVYVYGAYGDSMRPFFFPIFLDWAAQGGILAFPHVRGGGEKGPQWHEHGSKNLKYNSWKDLIACTEHLIDQNWTQKGKISLYTTSAGGITAGMAINERPNLFSSFIAEFPRMHPYGLEASSTASSTSYLEYGSVRDSIELRGLLAMDPYLNLQKNRNYPPTLLFTSYNDDRIPLWDNGKYVARLQANTHMDGPVLMDIDYETGHGQYNGYDASIILHSKIFGFAQTHLK